MNRKYCERHAPNIYDSWCYECKKLNETWWDKHSWTIGFFATLAVVVLSFGWGGFCLLKFGTTPFLQVPYYCHVSR